MSLRRALTPNAPRQQSLSDCLAAQKEDIQTAICHRSEQRGGGGEGGRAMHRWCVWRFGDSRHQFRQSRQRYLAFHWALTTATLPLRTRASLARMAMSSAARRVAARIHRALPGSSIPRRPIHASSASPADQRQHSDRSAWHNVSAGPADHYRILNIPHHATKAEVKRAYLLMGEPGKAPPGLG